MILAQRNRGGRQSEPPDLLTGALWEHMINKNTSSAFCIMGMTTHHARAMFEPKRFGALGGVRMLCVVWSVGLRHRDVAQP
jgi:hypothetical protein